ncbi:alpha/beta-hydrolase [Astrocystis sublimbata]|nr:alpha/beta-hydrolase [Astrocystis sublimbata]
MALTQSHRTVSFKTLDGLNLEAWLWEAQGPAPAIVMTHGLNCVKEMSLAETAEAFQSEGYNVLLYDSRSVGGSEGLPRNQVDPWQNAQDVSDVVSYVSTLRSVDSKKIILWGMSLGGSISGCAAAIDTRVSGVIMICPIFTFIRPDKRKSVFSQLMKDRVSQLRGNEPFSIPPFNSKGENPAGYAGSGGPGGLESHTLMKLASERGHRNFRDRITLQSFHKLALFRPRDLMEEMLAETPTMMVVPELDTVSLPKDQMAAFEIFKTPKQLYLATGTGHMDVLSGKESRNVMQAMLRFCESALEGTIQ